RLGGIHGGRPIRSRGCPLSTLSNRNRAVEPQQTQQQGHAADQQDGQSGQCGRVTKQFSRSLPDQSPGEQHDNRGQGEAGAIRECPATNRKLQSQGDSHPADRRDQEDADHG
ncbi:MAG: hypothetical protein ACK56F_08685, partial [bacterium]